MTRWAVLALTAVTGFTGLAYEVAWQKYLAILLGAHSEATAAVLGLFLGGPPFRAAAPAGDPAGAPRVPALGSAGTTAGAFAGSLATGFVLIRWLGLEPLLHRLGALNLAVGALLVLAGARRPAIASLAAPVAA